MRYAYNPIYSNNSNPIKGLLSEDAEREIGKYANSQKDPMKQVHDRLLNGGEDRIRNNN